MKLLEKENIPNALTILRLLLAAVVFVLLSLFLKARLSGGGFLGPIRYLDTSLGGLFQSHGRLILNINFVLFTLAVLTDALDGELARRWEVTTTFGRIADPFADKILISGVLVMLVPLSETVLPLAPWMVVVILAREYMVTSIRGFLESQGLAFPASKWGKAKMILQSFCVGGLLLFLANAEQLHSLFKPLLTGLVWATVGVTFSSGVVYIQRARSILKDKEREEGQSGATMSDLNSAEPGAESPTETPDARAL